MILTNVTQTIINTPAVKPVLYHGSNLNLNLIKPIDKYVYATDLYEYALCFAGNRLDNIDISFKPQLTLTETKENAFKQTFDTDGYIYALDYNLFHEYSPHIFVSLQEIKPIESLHIYNIYNCILQTNIILNER